MQIKMSVVYSILIVLIITAGFFAFKQHKSEVTGMAVSDPQSLPKPAASSTDESFPAVKFASVDYNSATGLVYQGVGADKKEHIYKDKTELSIQGKQHGSVNIIDYNNDGKWELFTTGFYTNSKGQEVADTGLYGNSLNKVGSFPNVKNSASCWGDFDNNGFYELVLTGEDDNGKKYFNVYKNENGEIALDYSLGGISQGSVKCFDYNNDGWTDVVVCGQDNSFKAVSYLFENNMGSLQQKTEFHGLWQCSVDSNNFNGNNRLDIVISGLDNARQQKTYLYINSGNSFSEKEILTDIIFQNPSISSGDYNNDGTADLAISGMDSSSKTSKTNLYKNIAGEFQKEDISILQASDGAVLFLNQNDQNLDLFITGEEWVGINHNIKSQMILDIVDITGSPGDSKAASSMEQSGNLNLMALNPTIPNLVISTGKTA